MAANLTSPFIITQPESWYSFYNPAEERREKTKTADLSIDVGDLAAKYHLTNTPANMMTSKRSPLGSAVLRLGWNHPLLVQINLYVRVLLVRQTEDSLRIRIQSVHYILCPNIHTTAV